MAVASTHTSGTVRVVRACLQLQTLQWRPRGLQNAWRPLVDLANAAGAGAITACMVNPLWVVNTRIKLRKGKSKGILTELWRLITSEGVTGCYQGIYPSLVLVANPAIQFMCAELFRRYLKRRWGARAEIGPFLEFWIGALSKLIATFLMYPYQVLKTRMQQSKAMCH